NGLMALPIMVLSAGLMMTSCKKKGCTDETATNYNTEAQKDDGSCVYSDPETNPEMESSTYEYEFNNGQVVETEAYDGIHMDNLMATMMVEEVSSTEAEVSVTLTNTVDGETYMIHAHDAMDPSNTPNGTPYDETPNGDVFIQMAEGNGGDVTVTQTVPMSYSDIVNDYEGFFVVHDPLQQISTVDISTYLVVGSFAREQTATGLSSMTYDYDFNTGQVDPSYEYNGTHNANLNAMLKVQELASGESRVSVAIMNSINGETYMVHAHDMADPANTPNGTPYDETPNGNVLAISIEGNGMTAYNNQHSSMSFTGLTNNYDAFLVIHDPLQTISTTDPTTYVVLGVFAN
ncbi:MAG: hypothetical protein WED10_13790, partial [Brumimicrobium sp.]